jgi:lipoate-protein ligase A
VSLTPDGMSLIDMLDQRLSHPTNAIMQDMVSIIRSAVANLTESPHSHPTMEEVCKEFVTLK